MSAHLEPYEHTPVSRPDDPRLGDLVRFSRDGQLAAGSCVAILGFPSDEGVRINDGRPGAAAGPDRIRKFLYAMTPDARAADSHSSLLASTTDLGNVRCSGHVAEDQQRLGEVLAPLIKQGVIPILLGGGHETSFGHFLGYVLAGRKVSILNIDAHPDVRPLVDGRPHSGSPFRQALEHSSGACHRYDVAGLNPQSVARAHVEFVASRGGRCFWNGEFTIGDLEALIADSSVPLMTTFDLDAVDGALAPGVSAPAAHGLPPSLWLQLAHVAGRSSQVTSMDIVELNPLYDVDDRTARLAALTVWQFLRGIVHRNRP